MHLKPENLHSETLDKTTRIILFAAFVIQLITALNGVGYFHPDQHFSIIEFATYKLGITSEEHLVWEFSNRIRPTIQVYLFLGFYKFMQFLHLDYAYTSDLILRIIVSCAGFILYNIIILKQFKNDSKSTLYIILGIANFSWFLPYIHSLFSSETLGGLVYFFAVLLYLHFKSKSLTLIRAMVIGFILSLAFYFRFQIGFAILGFSIWVLFYEKTTLSTLLGIGAGFLLGVIFNTVIDSHFYGEFSFTPYSYFYANIIEGRASATGTKSFIYYILLLSVMFTAPLLSLFLLFYIFRGFIKKFGDVFSLSVIVFLFLHFIIPHKEDRFLFPVAGILPVILGYGIRDYTNKLPAKIWKNSYSVLFNFIAWASVILNVFLLYIMLTIPISQSIYFTKKINEYFDYGENVKIVFYDRTPFETPGIRNVHTYYKHFKNKNINIIVTADPSEFKIMMDHPDTNTWFAAAYGQEIDEEKIYDMACTPVMVSSPAALEFNQWLNKHNWGPVLDVWILFKCGDSD